MKRKTFHCEQDIVVCSQTGSIVICNHHGPQPFIQELMRIYYYAEGYVTV